jgi:hypothetical protein
MRRDGNHAFSTATADASLTGDAALTAYGAALARYLRDTDAACVGVPLSRVGVALPLPALLRAAPGVRGSLARALAALPALLRLFVEPVGAGTCTYVALRDKPPRAARPAPQLLVTIVNDVCDDDADEEEFWEGAAAAVDLRVHLLRRGRDWERSIERSRSRSRVRTRTPPHSRSRLRATSRRRAPSPRAASHGLKRRWDLGDEREAARRAAASPALPRRRADTHAASAAKRRRRWDEAAPAAAPWAQLPFAAGARLQGPAELLPQCGVARAQQRARWPVDFDASASAVHSDARAPHGAALRLRLTRCAAARRAASLFAAAPSSPRCRFLTLPPCALPLAPFFCAAMSRAPPAATWQR